MLLSPAGVDWGAGASLHMGSQNVIPSFAQWKPATSHCRLSLFFKLTRWHC